ncbi:IS200/IS605 family transposase [Labilibaculum antarcticum]|uniref:IS200/IS605 family transposase n=1 Tax=Labilibaculum antarcticum TaxID=1717717 RepID=UPI000BBB38CE|nr:IS200/IS605 family transposase [Labilibaculum antarcticum]
MGQSLVQNYLHIVFSTKHREALIHSPHEEKLHAYLGKTCNELSCPILIVGGHVDHIHLLCMLSKNSSLVELIKRIKTSSSRWMKMQSSELAHFYWQDGYGAFSVNPTEVDVIRDYIQNQHQHHKKHSFQDEYRAFLKKYKVDYDERYIWD